MEAMLLKITTHFWGYAEAIYRNITDMFDLWTAEAARIRVMMIDSSIYVFCPLLRDNEDTHRWVVSHYGNIG